jgi:hypothetical protein
VSIPPEVKVTWPAASLPFVAGGGGGPWWLVLVAAGAILLVVGGTKLMNVVFDEYAAPVLRARRKNRVAKIRKRGKKVRKE